MAEESDKAKHDQDPDAYIHVPWYQWLIGIPFALIIAVVGARIWLTIIAAIVELEVPRLVKTAAMLVLGFIFYTGRKSKSIFFAYTEVGAGIIAIHIATGKPVSEALTPGLAGLYLLVRGITNLDEWGGILLRNKDVGRPRSGS